MCPPHFSCPFFHPRVNPKRTERASADPGGPGGSAAAVLRMRCPICLDEVPLTVLAGCSHAACQPCLAQFFTTLETTGSPWAKCPMPDCHTPVAPEAVWSLLGRAYKPAAAETATNTDPHEVDRATAEWLESQTKLCGGCGARVCKSDGCDKMQCLCGYRFCWRCGSVDATCNCNPGHGFFDNVMRRPDFSRDTRQATALEAQDMATFLAQVRRSMDEAEAHKLAMREELEARFRQRETSSLRRKGTIIQRVIQDDVSSAVELYLQEIEDCGGGTPVWAGEISPYLRFMGSEEIGALFPGVPLPVRRS